MKWLKDGDEVALVNNSTQKSRYDVDATDYSLTISEVALEDGGIYDCAMFNTRSKEFVIKAKQRYQLAVHGLCENILPHVYVTESGHVSVQNSHYFNSIIFHPYHRRRLKLFPFACLQHV